MVLNSYPLYQELNNTSNLVYSTKANQIHSNRKTDSTKYIASEIDRSKNDSVVLLNLTYSLIAPVSKIEISEAIISDTSYFYIEDYEFVKSKTHLYKNKITEEFYEEIYKKQY